jgi:hypothetical protein
MIQTTVCDEHEQGVLIRKSAIVIFSFGRTYTNNHGLIETLTSGQRAGELHVRTSRDRAVRASNRDGARQTKVDAVDYQRTAILRNSERKFKQ